MVERPVLHHLAGAGGVDGIIHIQLRVVDGVRHTQRVGGKGQVIVPGQHAQPPVFLVEKIVVAGAAQVAVQIDGEHLHHKVPQHPVQVHRLFQLLPGGKLLQRFDQPLLVRRGGVELGGAEDVVVVFLLRAGVAQGHVRVFVGKALVVRLVQLAVVRPEAAAGKSLLRLLHRQEQPPVLPVHRHPHIAAQGRGHAHVVHHPVGGVVF